MSAGDGILPVLKPPGPSSSQVVQAVRTLFGRGSRVGHAGTLDPEAAGVLPICVGSATRLAEYLQRPAKVYRFELVLGIATDTQDATGRVVTVGATDVVSEDSVRAALAPFCGRIVQRAPMYSARHHDGRRLYEIARAGGQAPRPEFHVQVWNLQLLHWSRPMSLPPVALCEVRCSSGTYVRALCDDIGRHLGCGAHMGALLRCAAAGIPASACCTVEEIESAARDGKVADLLIPGAAALEFLPAVTVDDGDAAAVRYGRAPGRRRQAGADGAQTVRVLDGQGRLLAIASQRTQANVAEFVLEKVLVSDGGAARPPEA